MTAHVSRVCVTCEVHKTQVANGGGTNAQTHIKHVHETGRVRQPVCVRGLGLFPTSPHGGHSLEHMRDLLDAPTALAACCGFDLCHTIFCICIYHVGITPITLKHVVAWHMTAAVRIKQPVPVRKHQRRAMQASGARATVGRTSRASDDSMMVPMLVKSSPGMSLPGKQQTLAVNEGAPARRNAVELANDWPLALPTLNAGHQLRRKTHCAP
jgi:hypothetical protein